MITESEIAQSVDPRLASAQSFIKNVRALGTGDLAVLRRNAGIPLAEARNVTPILYRLLDDEGYKNEGVYYMIATLVAFDKRAVTPLSQAAGDLGRSYAALALEGNWDAVSRRFRILLDADLDWQGDGEMVFRLRQAVKLLLSKDIPINWSRLLVDVRAWSRPQSVRAVRRRWAMSFYGRFETAVESPIQNDPGNADDTAPASAEE